MIKINLLQNQLSTPVAKETLLKKDDPTGQTFRSEARKSGARTIKLVVVLLVLIGGSIWLYMERYAAVGWVEQYTGPLNILPAQEEAPTPEMIEEQRRERIRELYMVNTIKQQSRDLQFLTRLDSLRMTSANVFVSSFILDGNDYAIDFYGKTEKDVTEFTNAYLNTRLIDETKPEKIERDAKIAGFRFRRSLTGTVKAPPASENDTVSTTYIPIDKAKKKIKLLALADSIKAEEIGTPKESKAVIMTKHSTQFRFSGETKNFLKFIATLGKLNLNVEMTRYEFTYTVRDPKQKDRKKIKPDVILFDYNILIPTSVSDTSKTAGK